MPKPNKYDKHPSLKPTVTHLTTNFIYVNGKRELRQKHDGTYVRGPGKTLVKESAG